MTTSDEFIDEEEAKNEHIPTIHLLGGPYDGNLIYDTEKMNPEIVFVKFPVGDEYDHQLEFTYWFNEDLETLREVLEGENKIILDDSGSGQGVVPYLPLNELKKRSSN